MLSPEAYLRDKVRMTWTNAKRRSEKEALVFDLDFEHLLSIFPKDMVCPALGIKMAWGNDTSRDVSPSLDRIKPDEGYVNSNVVWVSSLANRIKSNASVETLGKIYDFYKDRGKEKGPEGP